MGKLGFTFLYMGFGVLMTLWVISVIMLVVFIFQTWRKYRKHSVYKGHE